MSGESNHVSGTMERSAAQSDTGKRTAQAGQCSNAWAFRYRELDAEGEDKGTSGISEAWRRSSADGIDEERVSFKGDGGTNDVQPQKFRLKGPSREDSIDCLFAEEVSAVR